MSVTFKAPHRIWLYQPYDSHIYNTGGWEAVETEYAADEGNICEAEFVRDQKHMSLYLPTDIDGNIVLYVRTSPVTSSIQEVKLRTAKVVDFHRLKWLRFLFTRDDVGRKDNIFTKSVTVKVLDENLNELRIWDSAGKACHKERGEINIDGIRRGYIEICLRAEIASAAQTLIDINDNDLYTIDDELLQIAEKISIDFQKDENWVHLVDQSDEYLMSTEKDGSNLFLVISDAIRYSICLFIYNMWIE